MIDTIKISLEPTKILAATELERRGWLRNHERHTGEKRDSWFIPKNGTKKTPSVALFRTPKGNFYLTVEVSIPNFLFGSNVKLPSEVEVQYAFEELSAYVAHHTGSSIDLTSGAVCRIDFPRDFIVGRANLHRILMAIADVSIPRFRRLLYSDSTVYFGTGKNLWGPRILRIYDKGRETLRRPVPKALEVSVDGVLRMEYSFQKSAVVARLAQTLGLPDRQVRTLMRASVAERALDSVDKYIAPCLEESLEIHPFFQLTRKVGRRRAAALIQFLTYYNNFGSDFWRIGELGYGRSAYYRDFKLARDLLIPFGQFHLLDLFRSTKAFK